MHAVGIQFDGLLLRKAHLKKTRQGIRVVSSESYSIDPVKPLYIGKKPYPLISGLSAGEFLTRTIPCPSGPTAQVKKALLLQIEAQTHLQPEEVIILPPRINKGGTASVFFTTRSTLDAHLKAFKTQHLSPTRTSAAPLGLQTFIQWKSPQLSSYFAFHLGEAESQCLWIEQGQLQKAHTIQFGKEHLRNAFLKDREKWIALKKCNEIHLSLLKTGQCPLLLEQLRSLRRSLLQILTSFNVAHSIVFTGDIESIAGLREFLLEGVSSCIAGEQKIAQTKKEQQFALSIGLALEYLLEESEPIQFLTQTFCPPSIWRALGKNAFLLATFSSMLGLGLYQAGHFLLDKKEKTLIEHIENWQPSLTGKDGCTLSKKWLDWIEVHAKENPFIDQSHGVSALLNWLSKHPLLCRFQDQKELFFLEDIRYTRVCFPRLGALKDPYETKVELTFFTPDGLLATQFRDSLFEKDSLANSSQEITWDVNQDQYKTSFFLKKPSYVSF